MLEQIIDRCINISQRGRAGITRTRGSGWCRGSTEECFGIEIMKGILAFHQLCVVLRICAE